MSERYDVVIIGGGIAGAIIAKRLAENQRSVLILEAGTGVGFTGAGYQSFVATYHAAVMKIPNSAYPQNSNAPQPYVTDTEKITDTLPNSKGYFVQAGPHAFGSTNTRAAGGTVLHWLGTSLRMLPSDFKMYSRYGRGVDWPIDHSTMLPWYALAEQEIGVSADVAKQRELVPEGEQLYREGYQYPMLQLPQSYLDERLSAALSDLQIELAGQKHEVALVGTPAGRNSNPNPDYPGPDPADPKSPKGFRPVGSPYPDENHQGERCQGNSSCIPICPVHAKYTPFKTLAAAAVEERVTVQVRSVVSDVAFDENGVVTHVNYKRYDRPDDPSHTTHRAVGKIYVLAAHSIENSKIMLASNGARNCNELGRNLMDHPTILTWGAAPEPMGSYRGPGSTSGIATFRDGAFRSEHAAFRIEVGNWGWNWAANAPLSTVGNTLRPKSGRTPWGGELRRQLYDQCQRHMRLATLVEQTPLARNRVTIDPAFRDPLGNYRAVLHYDYDEYTRLGLKAAVQVSRRIFAHAGIRDRTTFEKWWPYYMEVEGQPLVAFGAGHIVGTHRMGTAASNSVTDTDMRCWDHDNLYMVGCGSMPTIGTSNPTLTLAALAMKAAHSIDCALGES